LDKSKKLAIGGVAALIFIGAALASYHTWEQPIDELSEVGIMDCAKLVGMDPKECAVHNTETRRCGAMRDVNKSLACIQAQLDDSKERYLKAQSMIHEIDDLVPYLNRKRAENHYAADAATARCSAETADTMGQARCVHRLLGD
jgi:hypothetical protein